MAEFVLTIIATVGKLERSFILTRTAEGMERAKNAALRLDVRWAALAVTQAKRLPAQQ